jgi:hypothetical protein
MQAQPFAGAVAEMKAFFRGFGAIFGLALALFCAVGAAAVAAPPARPPAVQSVIDCRRIEDGVQRLACYDKAVAAMDQAEASGDLVTVDREQRRAARRQAFGLVLPSLAFLDRGEKPEEVDTMTAKVASAAQDPYGKWTIQLDDGAIWRQIDDIALDRPAHAGSIAEIRRGALGSFRMKLDGQFPIRVRRDR